jgi:biotin carboxylase
VARVLLIIPTASYRAPEFLDAARRLSVEVVTGSERPQALAQTMGDRFIELPLADPVAAADAIVALAGRVDLDAILAVDDQGSLAAAYAGERLGLLHNRPDAVAATRDKAVMRQRLAVGGVAQPRYEAVGAGGGSRGARVAAAAGGVGYPVVIKPVSLSGSRGVIRVDDAAAAKRASERIEAILGSIGEPATTLLVEEFIPGIEVALEGLLHDGALEVLALFDKPDPLDGPYFEETIYLTPSSLPLPTQDAIAALVGDAARAIGLAEGPVHAEVRLRPGDAPPAARVVLIELAARTIGGRCATALRFSTGATLEEIVLAHALGRDTAHETPTTGASGVMMLPIPMSGRLVRVGGREAALAVDGITDLDISIAPGRHVAALPEGDRYLGFLFAAGATADKVDRALREAHRRLIVEIEP